MDVHDRDLKSLLKEEREARQRYEQLRGYPPNEQAKALALWQEATEAVRKYRWPQCMHCLGEAACLRQIGHRSLLHNAKVGEPRPPRVNVPLMTTLQLYRPLAM
jgi:hypothetical protein